MMRITKQANGPWLEVHVFELRWDGPDNTENKSLEKIASSIMVDGMR